MRRVILVFLFLILCSTYSNAAIREFVYDGKEIYLHVKISHMTTVIFLEPIVAVIRGFGADAYIIQRNNKETNKLELMPVDSELGEMTVTGVSGEDYVLRCVKDENFDTKVTISSVSQVVKNSDILTANLVNKKSEETKESDEKTINIKEDILLEPKVGTHDTLVTIMPPPAPTSNTALKEVDTQKAETANENTLPAELNLKITLKGNSLPLKVYLSTISQVTGYNIITTPDIDSQKTSINLENIEVWRALKSLLYKFGYGFKVSQSDLIITETETRIFNISQPPVNLSFSDETSNESSSNNQSGSSSSSSGNQQAEQVNIGTKIFYQNKSADLSLWTELENNIKSLISPKDGSYSINKASGYIVVTDKPLVLDKIGDLVNTVNNTLGRQQSFEIQIIEVTLNNDFETGIDFNAIAKKIAGLNNITASTNFTAAGFVSGQLFSLSATGPTTTSGTSSGGINMFLKALDGQGSVNVVSKPTITVSNLFPCIIQSVTAIPYISGTGTTLSNTASQSSVQTSTVSTGLTMRLEGKIEDDKTVLNISAAENTLDSMTTVPVGGGLTIQEPQVSTKSITTNVSVEPGKTLILGGLMSSTKTISKQGIPYLDKIPVIGGAFGYKGNIDEKTELVIIITPKKSIKNL